MSTTAKSYDFVVLGDDEGQLYVIHRQQMNQYRMIGETNECEKFLADGCAINTTLRNNTPGVVEAFRILGVFSEDSLLNYCPGTPKMD
jgi:hypothetical protein